MPLHLRRRSGVWHYSRTVPDDVSQVVGARYWRFSLNTRSLRDAEAQRSKWDCKHQALIESIRGSDMRRLESGNAGCLPERPSRTSPLTSTLQEPPPVPCDSLPVPRSHRPILDALEEWLAENKQKPSTVAKYRLHVRRLTEHVGNAICASLTSAQVADFVEAYGRLPNARSLSLSQRKFRMPELLALRRIQPWLPCMGAVNVRKMIEYLRAFLRAVGRGDLCTYAKKPR